MIEAARFQETFFRHKSKFLIAILLIFYTVGTVGLTLDTFRDQFLPLSFFNLLLSFVILLIARFEHSKKFYFFLLFAFLIGMTAEWIGVHTGLLFGDYAYGENLGVKIGEVPLIIGINWAMLVIISASLAETLVFAWYIKAFIASVFMLFLDFLIEPVAIVSDYWTWNGEIPLSNYVTWFLVTLLLQGIYFRFKLAETNKVAIALYGIQVLFFTILNLV